MPLIDREGIAIHYEVHGSARGGLPLLLTHGFGATGRMWAGSLGTLAAERTVITWDLRGHGHSDAPDAPGRYTVDHCVGDIEAILDALDIEQVALGGHSLGGFITLAFHRAHPTRVAAMLLVDTGPGYRNDEARASWNRRAERIADAIEQHGLDGLRGHPEMIVGHRRATGLARAARGILTQHDATVIDSLPAVDVPTLVLVGERDEPYLAGAAYLAEKIPGARSVVIPGAGHAVNIDAPTAFDHAVTEFLRHLPHD